MKAGIYNTQAKKEKDMALPKLFATPVREDLVQKYYEIEKTKHPYSPGPEAGKHHSASGTISHQRHQWKGHYGRGISRVPRKTMWRRGTQFFWIGAEVSGTRGGRRAHPPRVIRRPLSMNKKERRYAFNSALAATASPRHVQARYTSIKKIDLTFPIIVSSDFVKLSTKDFHSLLRNIFGAFSNLVFKNARRRAGKGAMRGRRYKKNAGLLVVCGNKENLRVQGVDIRSSNKVHIHDLYPLGRLTVYTEQAMEELSKL